MHDHLIIQYALHLFTGITGTVSIDANGDRNGDYSLLDMNPKTGQFQVSASLKFNTQMLMSIVVCMNRI